MRLTILTTLFLGAAVPAQMFWTRLAPANPPAPDDRYEMVATANPPGLLLFGGGPAASTWRFAGGQWVQLSPTRSPAFRYGHVMAFDPARDRVVLFGGANSTGLLDDTWEWDGSDWTLLTPAVSPPARFGAAMAYDPTSGETVLHGGRIAGLYAGDTWTWDGTTWSRSSSAYNPGPRSHAAMGSSEHFGILLFGGNDPFGQLDDTWYYRGGLWYRQPVQVRPSARLGHSLTHDPVRDRFVLHGGTDFGSVYHDDTWEFSSTAGWVRITPSTPGPRVADHAAAYDPQIGGVVTIGGATFVVTGSGGHRQQVGDTHVYAPTVRASTTRIGNGCGGIRDLEVFNRPILGEPAFGFRAIPQAINPSTVSVAGLSLASVNPPGRFGPCDLHLASTLLTLAPAFPGTSYRLAIPADPALRGLRFFVQVFETERVPGSGWNQLAFSPAYEIVIGD